MKPSQRYKVGITIFRESQLFHFEQEMPGQGLDSCSHLCRNPLRQIGIFSWMREKINLLLFLKRVNVRYIVKSWKFHKDQKYQGNENFNYWALNFKVASQTYLWKSFKCLLPLKVNDITSADVMKRDPKSEWIWYFTAFAQSRIRIRYVPLMANKTHESPFHWCSGRSWSTAPKALLSISKHFLSDLHLRCNRIP